MLSSVSFLRRCEALANAGFHPTLEPGMRVGRGYADVGAGEFLLLPDNKLLSLFTGEVRVVPPLELTRLFVIPTPDQMLDYLHRLGVDVSAINTPDQRRWSVHASHGVFEADTVEEALIEALVAAAAARQVAQG